MKHFKICFTAALALIVATSCDKVKELGFKAQADRSSFYFEGVSGINKTSVGYSVVFNPVGSDEDSEDLATSAAYSYRVSAYELTDPTAIAEGSILTSDSTNAVYSLVDIDPRSAAKNKKIFEDVLSSSFSVPLSSIPLSSGKTYVITITAAQTGRTKALGQKGLRIQMQGDQCDLTFDGLQSAQAMSDSKVYLKWQAASGATSNELRYAVYLSPDYSKPISTTPENFLIVSNGLRRNTSYTFLVRAYCLSSGFEKSALNKSEKTAKTLAYTTPDFDGIETLAPAPGIDGLSCLDIGWSPAAGSTTGYRVYVSQGSGGQNYNSSTATNGSNTTSVLLGAYLPGQFTQSTRLCGLSPNTAYYAVVRSFNFDGTNAFSDINTIELAANTNAITPDLAAPVVSRIGSV